MPRTCVQLRQHGNHCKSTLNTDKPSRNNYLLSPLLPVWVPVGIVRGRARRGGGLHTQTWCYLGQSWALDGSTPIVGSSCINGSGPKDAHQATDAFALEPQAEAVVPGQRLPPPGPPAAKCRVVGFVPRAATGAGVMVKEQRYVPNLRGTCSPSGPQAAGWWWLWGRPSLLQRQDNWVSCWTFAGVHVAPLLSTPTLAPLSPCPLLRLSFLRMC